MKKFANIIYENGVELTNHKPVVWINYISYSSDNEVTSMAVNYNLPTLFIGWKNFQRIYANKMPINILNKKPKSRFPIQWEFSMDEKIVDHFSGIEDFIKNAPRKYVELFQYKSIDPIADRIETVDELWAGIPNGVLSYYQYKDEIIYVLNRTKGEIYGIYLIAFKYFGLDNKIIANYFDNKIITKTIDSDGSIYQSYYRQFPDFDQLKRAMVLFLM